MVIECGMRRQLTSRITLGRHDEQIEIAGAIGRKQNPSSIRGPTRSTIDGRLGRESRDVSSVRMDLIELDVAVPVAGKDEPFAVGRPARLMTVLSADLDN